MLPTSVRAYFHISQFDNVPGEIGFFRVLMVRHYGDRGMGREIEIGVSSYPDVSYRCTVSCRPLKLIFWSTGAMGVLCCAIAWIQGV